jgi:hypothetical protein
MSLLVSAWVQKEKFAVAEAQVAEKPKLERLK